MKTAEQSRIIIDDERTSRWSFPCERESYLVERAETGREAIRESKGNSTTWLKPLTEALTATLSNHTPWKIYC